MAGKRVWLVAALSIIMGLSLNAGAAALEEKPCVGIAWSDSLSDTYFAVCQAIEAAGGTPVILEQVRLAGFEDDSGGMLAGLKDQDGALTLEAAKKMRRDGWRESNAAEVMEGMKVIVFPGGADISPSLYDDPQPVLIAEGFSAQRDISDYLLMTYCLDHDIPILAICRGMQMMSIVSGAEMIQDLAVYMKGLGEDYGFEHRSKPDASGAYHDFAFHNVAVTDRDSILYRLTGTDTVSRVPSWHHQAVKSVEGTPLVVTGLSATGGKTEIIEAVERPDKTFALGLQYHPEMAVARRLDETSLAYFAAIVMLAR